MNSIEIEEGNLLIAKFMDYYFQTGKFYSKGNGHWFKEAKYHRSWEALMPVVEKINQSGEYDVIIFRTTCHVNDPNGILFETSYETSKKGVLIESVWQPIVQFLKWFYENNS